MSNEDTTNPVDVADPEVEHDDTSLDDSSDDSDDNEDDDGSAEDDSEEIEHEGAKYKIPKALKPALMFQADYTRKTQEVAEQRRAVDEDRQRFQQDAQAHNADIQEYATLVSVDNQLKQFEQVNWQTLSQSDPVQAQQLWFQFSQLKDARQQLAGTLTQRQQQRHFDEQQKTAKQLEEGRAALARDIKDWSPQLAEKLIEFAAADGWSRKEIEAITPAQVKSLHRSYIGAQLLSKQKPSAPAAPAAKPVTQVGTSAPARKPVEKMSDAEFAAMRKAQIKKRR